MKSAIFTSLLAVFSGLVASVPVSGAEPSEIEARAIKTIYPSLIVNIWSPDSGRKSDYALVSRYTEGGIQHDTNSLIAYTFTQGYPGKTCTFSFQKGWNAYGTRKVQLFTVAGEIKPSNTFTSRPSRNLERGIFTITPNGATGTWDDIPTPKFDCPTSATTIGFEVVPQGDYDYAGWDITSGLAVVVL